MRVREAKSGPREGILRAGLQFVEGTACRRGEREEGLKASCEGSGSHLEAETGDLRAGTLVH